MAVTLQSVAIISDQGGAVNRRDATGLQPHQKFPAAILGLNIMQLRVRVETDGAAAAPAKMIAQVRFRRPGQQLLAAKAPVAFSFTLHRDKGQSTFNGMMPLNSLMPALQADETPEVATVIRQYGTSDKKFSRPLVDKGWAFHGRGVQPDAGKPPVTGGMKNEEPDALSLFLAGGVEVLEVTVPAGDGVNCPFDATVWAFIRSPADVLFYSGHGLLTSGALVIAYSAFSHNYEDWLSPEGLLQHWGQKPGFSGSPTDLDALVINGCSVLFWNHDPNEKTAADRANLGLRWAELLCTRKGPLRTILGYRYKAPPDSPFGDLVAERMAKAIIDGLGIEYDRYAQKWLEINAAIGPWGYGAAAIDQKGYWYVNTPTHAGAGDSMIMAVGHDAKKPAGTVMGPFALQ